jgi:methylenetetrahydrofolate dehydrogenase (NADP+)/methenyltetrahydrofolate cyclohydrolase
MPVAFITGHGDVSMAVSTMKRGAVDFIEKPFKENDLCALVDRMLSKARVDYSQASQRKITHSLLSKLTGRERQVLERIVAGRLNKQIADDLGISIKTVDAHRANLMEKLNVNTVADLLRLALSDPQPNEFSMPAQLLDCVALSKKIRTESAARGAIVTAKGVRPGLAVIVVGENPASQVYVRNKVKACEDVGFHSVLERYSAELGEKELLVRIATLNTDPAIHGILVQLPLPEHIAAERVLEAISPEKDVDGFHVANAGALMVGQPEFKPCTPYGCMKILESIDYPIRGARAVIVGASNIVGKPMAMLLLQAGATVTICNSKTRDLAHHTKDADILVVATGKPKMITGDMVKTGAVVIDVGINRLPDGKLCGDIDFDAVRYIAGWITPVPGGVGPMTITMLLMNTLEAAEKASKPSSSL